MPTIILAKDFIDSDGVIVRSGEKVANEVVSALRTNELVLISLEGMLPISSSYFNVIFKSTLTNFGTDALSRIQLHSASDLTRQIFDRSREACRRLSA